MIFGWDIIGKALECGEDVEILDANENSFFEKY